MKTGVVLGKKTFKSNNFLILCYVYGFCFWGLLMIDFNRLKLMAPRYWE